MSDKRKIYIITSGQYSDYHICGVTLDPEKAKEMKKHCWKNDFEGCEIEEYTEDEYATEYRFTSDELFEVWYIKMDEKGQIYDFKISCYTDDCNKRDYWLNTKNMYFEAEIATSDKELAKKLACDARAKMISEHLGL